jgi:hypothetical protein
VRPALSLVTVVVAAGLAAGCGGSDEPSATSPTTEWADGFCTAITTWTNTLQQTGNTITLSPSEETLQQAANDVETATDTLVDELDALGVPTTESGEEMTDAIEQLAKTLDEQVSVIEEAVAAVGPTGPAAAVPEIEAAFTQMRLASSSTLQAIVGTAAESELADAFEQTDSCDELTDSS